MNIKILVLEVTRGSQCAETRDTYGKGSWHGEVVPLWEPWQRWCHCNMAAILFLVPINWQWQQEVCFASHLTHETTYITRNGSPHSSVTVCPLISNNAYFYLVYMCNAYVYDTCACRRVGFCVLPCMCTICLRYVCEACVLTGLRWAISVRGVCQASWPLAFWVFPCLHLPSPCRNAGIWDSFATTFSFIWILGVWTQVFTFMSLLNELFLQFKVNN